MSSSLNIKICLTDHRGLHSNFGGCESFLESNCFDILALCETNLDDSIDSGNFFVRGYLLLIRKDSVTHMHGLAIYVIEEFPFAKGTSLENPWDTYCFWPALLHLGFYFFFLLLLSSSLCTVFDIILSNINEALSTNPSANLFAFENFSIHHKDWPTHSGGIDRPDKLCYNFSKRTLLIWITFVIPDWDSHSLFFFFFWC